MSSVLDLARPEIRALKAYEHAAWEPTLERLHANELPWRGIADSSVAGLHRYPEPQPRDLVERLAALYGVAANSVLVGRGSDEAIDLLVRAFCRAGEDSVVVCPPTFGMYAVAASIQGAKVVAVPLLRERGFALDEAGVHAALSAGSKLVFLCSPNNPTGNLIDAGAIGRLIDAAAGRALVVLDEAYVEFAPTPSLSARIVTSPHLAVLRTLSKAHGLAGARVGTLIAQPDIVALLRKIIPPYAMPQLTIEAACRALDAPQLAVTRARIAQVVAERARVAARLAGLPNVLQVWPSAANFLLVEFHDAARALQSARDARLLVRDFRSQRGLERALRITIGTPEQNERLLASLATELSS
jgi:histidinol-phosphate aminotransferase